MGKFFLFFFRFLLVIEVSVRAQCEIAITQLCK